MSYRVCRISIDKFGIVHLNALRICDEKAEAMKVRAEFESKIPQSLERQKIYVSAKVIVQPATVEAWQKLKEKADAINEKAIPKRDAWAKAHMAKFKEEGKFRDMEIAHMKNVGFHYDNQQRRNEYKRG